MKKEIAKMICKIFGHKEAKSAVTRSPYTVHTHYQDCTCARCGKDMGTEHLYFDALKQPEMFR